MMTHIHADIELWRLALLACVFVASVILFIVTGKDDDDEPPSAGSKMKLKGV